MPQQETGDPLAELTDELMKIMRRLPEEEPKAIMKQAENEVTMATKFILACEKAAMIAVGNDEDSPAESIRASLASQFSLEELTVADKGLEYLLGQLPLFRMTLIVTKNRIVHRG